MKSQLFHLVKMELFSSKKSLPMFILFPIFYPAFFRDGKTDILSYIFCIAIVGFLLFNGFAETDEKFKTGIMLNTLPVKRSEIIDARFISLYIVYAVITVVYFLAAAALHVIKPDIFGIMNLSVIPMGLVIVSVINVIQMPLYYIFDIQKSRMMSILIMFGIIILITFMFMQSWITPIINYFSAMSTAFINIILLLIAAIIFTVNRSVSERIYLKKEF